MTTIGRGESAQAIVRFCLKFVRKRSCGKRSETKVVQANLQNSLAVLFTCSVFFVYLVCEDISTLSGEVHSENILLVCLQLKFSVSVSSVSLSMFNTPIEQQASCDCWREGNSEKQ